MGTENASFDLELDLDEPEASQSDRSSEDRTSRPVMRLDESGHILDEDTESLLSAVERKGNVSP